jgi:8-oxo-dGTP diphosphatase
VAEYLDRLRRTYDEFEVVSEERVVPRTVYTDCLQAAEAGSLGGARVFLESDGRLLLVRYEENPDVWDLPGGPTERGESLEQTARHRAFEDTGVTCRLGDVARVVKQSFALVEGGDGVTGVWVFFRGETDETDVNVGEGVLEAKWFDRDEVPSAIGPHVNAILDRDD